MTVIYPLEAHRTTDPRSLLTATQKKRLEDFLGLKFPGVDFRVFDYSKPSDSSTLAGVVIDFEAHEVALAEFRKIYKAAFGFVEVIARVEASNGRAYITVLGPAFNYCLPPEATHAPSHADGTPGPDSVHAPDSAAGSAASASLPGSSTVAAVSGPPAAQLVNIQQIVSTMPTTIQDSIEALTQLGVEILSGTDISPSSSRVLSIERRTSSQSGLTVAVVQIQDLRTKRWYSISDISAVSLEIPRLGWVRMSGNVDVSQVRAVQDSLTALQAMMQEYEAEVQEAASLARSDAALPLGSRGEDHHMAHDEKLVVASGENQATTDDAVSLAAGLATAAVSASAAGSAASASSSDAGTRRSGRLSRALTEHQRKALDGCSPADSAIGLSEGSSEMQRLASACHAFFISSEAAGSIYGMTALRQGDGTIALALPYQQDVDGRPVLSSYTFSYEASSTASTDQAGISLFAIFCTAKQTLSNGTALGPRWVYSKDPITADEQKYLAGAVAALRLAVANHEMASPSSATVSASVATAGLTPVPTSQPAGSASGAGAVVAPPPSPPNAPIINQQEMGRPVSDIGPIASSIPGAAAVAASPDPQSGVGQSAADHIVASAAAAATPVASPHAVLPPPPPPPAAALSAVSVASAAGAVGGGSMTAPPPPAPSSFGQGVDAPPPAIAATTTTRVPAHSMLNMNIMTDKSGNDFKNLCHQIHSRQTTLQSSVMRVLELSADNPISDMVIIQPAKPTQDNDYYAYSERLGSFAFWLPDPDNQQQYRWVFPDTEIHPSEATALNRAAHVFQTMMADRDFEVAAAARAAAAVPLPPPPSAVSAAYTAPVGRQPATLAGDPRLAASRSAAAALPPAVAVPTTFSVTFIHAQPKQGAATLRAPYRLRFDTRTAFEDFARAGDIKGPSGNLRKPIQVSGDAAGQYMTFATLRELQAAIATVERGGHTCTIMNPPAFQAAIASEEAVRAPVLGMAAAAATPVSHPSRPPAGGLLPPVVPSAAARGAGAAAEGQPVSWGVAHQSPVVLPPPPPSSAVATAAGVDDRRSHSDAPPYSKQLPSRTSADRATGAERTTLPPPPKKQGILAWIRAKLNQFVNWVKSLFTSKPKTQGPGGSVAPHVLPTSIPGNDDAGVGRGPGRAIRHHPRPISSSAATPPNTTSGSREAPRLRGRNTPGDR